MYNSDNITTTDMGEFGFREIKMARDLLNAWIEQGLPDDFDDCGVIVMFNNKSGYVFLTNDSFEVAMINGDKLESWYYCPICGHEGFKENMMHNEDDMECQDYLKEIGVTKDK